jgi:DNA polymerase III subunit gamma/tau
MLTKMAELLLPGAGSLGADAGIPAVPGPAGPDAGAIPIPEPDGPDAGAIPVLGPLDMGAGAGAGAIPAPAPGTGGGAKATAGEGASAPPGGAFGGKTLLVGGKDIEGKGDVAWVAFGMLFLTAITTITILWPL